MILVSTPTVVWWNYSPEFSHGNPVAHFAESVDLFFYIYCLPILSFHISEWNLYNPELDAGDFQAA